MLEIPNIDPNAVVDEFIRYDGVVAAALTAAIQTGFSESLDLAITAALEKVQKLS